MRTGAVAYIRSTYSYSSAVFMNFWELMLVSTIINVVNKNRTGTSRVSYNRQQQNTVPPPPALKRQRFILFSRASGKIARSFCFL
jgi:hypothetical protein